MCPVQMSLMELAGDPPAIIRAAVSPALQTARGDDAPTSRLPTLLPALTRAQRRACASDVPLLNAYCRVAMMRTTPAAAAGDAEALAHETLQVCARAAQLGADDATAQFTLGMLHLQRNEMEVRKNKSLLLHCPPLRR